MINVNRAEVETVKMSVMRLEFYGLSVEKTLRDSIECLHRYYTESEKTDYLLAALARIQAYLELGFCYEQERELFDRILRALGTDRWTQFPKDCYSAKRLLLTKPQLRRAVKKWSASKYHTMSINEVLEDIISKVRTKKIGRYEYHSNANPHGQGMDYVYELLIEEDESYLLDVWNNTYYLLVEEECENEDCDSR